MAKLWEGIATRVKAIPKEAILRQAGEALAYWIMEQGLSVEGLEAKLLAGEPVLLDALATVPADQAAQIRQMAAPFVAQLATPDYPKVLQALADHPECQAHAQLIYRRYYHSHFVPAMEEAKRWMITGSPGA